jgi:hypothetical protein
MAKQRGTPTLKCPTAARSSSRVYAQVRCRNRNQLDARLSGARPPTTPGCLPSARRRRILTIFRCSWKIRFAGDCLIAPCRRQAPQCFGRPGAIAGDHRREPSRGSARDVVGSNGARIAGFGSLSHASDLGHQHRQIGSSSGLFGIICPSLDVHFRSVPAFVLQDRQDPIHLLFRRIGCERVSLR